MSSLLVKPEKGIVYTFYSFKGGVGRTMALSNVAALLAKWGRSVLIVDWDLEAPGLERFFFPSAEEATSMRSSKPGIIDLITGHRDGSQIDWMSCLHSRKINGISESVSIITAGREDGEYARRLQSIDFGNLFEHNGLGAYIEELRDAWTAKFDFVLIDSRTGVTDIGGICTVHLADVLVLLFTSTDSSTRGARDVIERARKAQSVFPVDRSRLLAVPVPSRDESRTEYERAVQWKRIYAEEFGSYYADWLPSGIAAIDAVETLRIPYVPYWSFGERLPVIEEGTNQPGTLGYSYQILARLLLTRLNWYEALDGQVLAPPPPLNLQIDPVWLLQNRRKATEGLRETGKSGFMEVFHLCSSASSPVSHGSLLSAAKQAVVPTQLGRPIGFVSDRDSAKPKATNRGIVAEFGVEPNFNSSYDYWALSQNGQFYSLSSFFEDRDNSKDTIVYEARIIRTTEALVHCAKLYRSLGAKPSADVEITIVYGGIRERMLSSIEPASLPGLARLVNHSEEQYTRTIRFRLSSLEMKLAELVKSVCEPFFALFDFATFAEWVYLRWVSNVLSRNGV